jgi:hypothetical protein
LLTAPKTAQPGVAVLLKPFFDSNLSTTSHVGADEV